MRKAVEWLREADGLLVTAGAGMCVDSGLPDFRGNEGLWRAYPALGAAQRSFQSIANPAAFDEDPSLAWGFYGHRLKLYREVQPHAGFAVLKRWADGMERGAFVFTSNVDGQFQRAAIAEDRVAECHGSIHFLQCSTPCGSHIWPATDFIPQVDEQSCRLIGPVPRCPECGGVARPNILMFWDAEWLSRRTDQQESRFEHWIASVRRPLIVEVGAGTALPTVRRFSERHGPRVIRINAREPQIDPAFGIGIQGSALATLTGLDHMQRAHR
ncbi:NAD-dependent deacetylase [Trinickia violacea]|uniref:protein acetyllysine N-acetyltransferase n=1 Tax=Trinickia violacea TaxID=2571746 RepID=A0A4P8J038_9BURK|nr:Sir2 family NAD-dependent protein deacetylase [Trinickia violacea]QCP51599.1 NAD-dependent deacetylase [Trinickia violacea]